MQANLQRKQPAHRKATDIPALRGRDCVVVQIDEWNQFVAKETLHAGSVPLAVRHVLFNHLGGVVAREGKDHDHGSEFAALDQLVRNLADARLAHPHGFG
ncbi:hypothetical protein SDC9_182742 [bioreactor metagenome]|uniref:Uncharacterized protein n=1 Tax=bioreactor metagenome TaxID=1076179 RepID=A0A645H8D4_9ZZZZ